MERQGIWGIAYSDQVGEVGSAPEVSQLVCVAPYERGG